MIRKLHYLRLKHRFVSHACFAIDRSFIPPPLHFTSSINSRMLHPSVHLSLLYLHSSIIPSLHVILISKSVPHRQHSYHTISITINHRIRTPYTYGELKVVKKKEAALYSTGVVKGKWTIAFGFVIFVTESFGLGRPGAEREEMPSVNEEVLIENVEMVLIFVKPCPSMQNERGMFCPITKGNSMIPLHTLIR